MRIVCLLGLAAALVGCAEIGALTPAEIDAIVAPAMEGKWAGGMVVAVYDKGRTSFRAYGTLAAAIEPEKTVFEIGSVTKTFTGLLLADAVTRGEVALDDAVAKYVDFAVPDFKDRKITLRHLATHTAGLPNVPPDFLARAKPGNPYVDYTTARAAAFLKDWKPPRPPGEKFEYSNLGMGLLAYALVRRIGASDLDEALAKRILGPLAMRDSGVAWTASTRARLTPGHDTRLAPTGAWDLPEIFAGAGALHSTAADMLRYVEVQLSPAGSVLGDAIVLSRTMHHRMSPRGGVGLGWLIGDDKSGRTFDHAGQTGGYTCYVGLAPARRVGVVVLSDTAGCGAMGTGIALLQRLRTGRRGEDVLPTAIAMPAAKLDRYVGTYRFGEVELAVRRRGDQLLLRQSGQPPMRLDPASPTRFFLRDLPTLPVWIEFELDAEGGASAMVIAGDRAERTQ